MFNTRHIQQLATILLRSSTDTAFDRLRHEARDQKQSITEIAKRRAANLLRSMSLYQGA